MDELTIPPFDTQAHCVTQLSADFCQNFERSKLDYLNRFSLLQYNNVVKLMKIEVHDPRTHHANCTKDLFFWGLVLLGI